jgi:hypothetical protein
MDSGILFVEYFLDDRHDGGAPLWVLDPHIRFDQEQRFGRIGPARILLSESREIDDFWR